MARSSEVSANDDKHSALTRRTLLGAVLATAVLPRLAYGQQGRDPASQELTDMRISMTFDGRTMTATLYDNPSARDFFSMAPLDLTIEDFSNNEKIAHLPRKLTEEGSGPFGNERPYDLCYFIPWGNLAMFYADYRHPGLITLGRFDEGYEALHVRGEFPLRVEAIS
ncbi:cyclophilin-like fold protein [Mesorhizobium wenxiniae]|uniref:MFS transporter n=1 Tax=Mesorhizobium wenxiniae TaxID=2014805 RepID=A0A271KJ60_9HYPH|nr:MFS transporter [Mesorhizobium wenxiniae]